MAAENMKISFCGSLARAHTHVRARSNKHGNRICSAAGDTLYLHSVICNPVAVGYVDTNLSQLHSEWPLSRPTVIAIHYLVANLPCINWSQYYWVRYINRIVHHRFCNKCQDHNYHLIGLNLLRVPTQSVTYVGRTLVRSSGSAFGLLYNSRVTDM